ncbi:MAG: hypothetical protein ACXW1T_08635, partial [Methylophilus sp.]
QNHDEYFINGIGFLKRLAEANGQVEQALSFNAMELRAKRNFEKLLLSPKQHADAKSFPFLTELMSWRLWVRLSNLFKDKYWFCIFTWCYEKLSDFGRSFTKPLKWLMFLFVISYIFGLGAALFHPPHLNQKHQLVSIDNLSLVIELENFVPISGYRAATEYCLYRSGNFLDFSDADKNTRSVYMRLFGQEIEPWWARIFGFFKGIFTAVLLFLTALGLRNKYRVG